MTILRMYFFPRFPMTNYCWTYDMVTRSHRMVSHYFRTKCSPCVAEFLISDHSVKTSTSGEITFLDLNCSQMIHLSCNWPRWLAILSSSSQGVQHLSRVQFTDFTDKLLTNYDQIYVDIFGVLSEYLTFVIIKIFIIKLRIALAPQSRNHILEFIFS